MKFGLLTAILDCFSLEEVLDFAEEMGFDCLEVACWPAGKAERRYAGVSHIDCERVLRDENYRAYVKDAFDKKGIEISALAYYPNPLDGNCEKREAAVGHLKNVILAADALGVSTVNTFIGRDQYKTVEENLEEMMKVWPSILALAENAGVRIGIENCPMLFGADQWPGGQNLMCTPAIFRRVFSLLPSKNLGLNFDPSHYVWQELDYLATLREFSDRIFHVHFKDIKLYPEKRKDVGVLAYPLSYMTPKIPSRGDVDWAAFVHTLEEVGFDGSAVIEVEDKDYEGSREAVVESIRISRDYLLPLLG